MKRFTTSSLPALALLGLVLGGCQPELDQPTASAGSADFSRYIAVGNSLTAGFSDNGLYREGQLNSYPSILAQQFAQVGGGPFVQPLFTEAQSKGSGYVQLLGFTPATATALSSPITGTVAGNGGRSTATSAPYTKFLDPINNLGVPGIRMSDILTPGYGSLAGNPYFERITPDATPLQTYLQRVQATVASIKPTFFTEWLGNNDVLGYATAGGAVASSGITPATTFAVNTSYVLDALTAGGAKGVVATIPDVTNIPFFTAVGPSFRANLDLNKVPTAAPFVYTTGVLAPGQANTRVSTTIASVRDANGTGNLLLTLTASPYVSLYGRPSGKYWRDFYRQATGAAPTGPAFSGFLTAIGVTDTTKGFGQATENPFPSTLVLDGTEQTNVTSATNNFNATLTAAANTRQLAIFDSNAFFRGVAQGGYVTNGVNNTAGFISGNLFSLDGVHPTPRGYAVIANEMMKVINAKYGSSLRQVDANSYRGVLFP
ncbi:SGNH/GDSL hydrolase family protein [Hymenobacter monticola]|uniref:SGNH/GDSL hydrolase family protein n=1 Tax=Hymenobacter monticola TaxID=1705399 RepID=A0ABY4B8T3_9BACT|nr:SGNH/GDSL hydrolase family protein [Hymenobacter monticola]UOE35289.1 SGNH/GDSL hydrolase family protein [Hymenobacter monticola]